MRQEVCFVLSLSLNKKLFLFAEMWGASLRGLESQLTKSNTRVREWKQETQAAPSPFIFLKQSSVSPRSASYSHLHVIQR